jgi:colicin import membrane protein
LESVDQEVKGMNQILQIRKQQAAIEQAAAQRRRDDLMNEIKLSNQINQIRLQRTEGGMGGKGDKDRTKTERDAKLDDLKRKQGDLEKAGGVMAERDAALNAMKNAGSEDEKNAAADLAQKKKAELEALGVSGDASAGALSTRLAQNKNEQQNAKVEQVVQRKGYEDDVRIAMARTKEDYGVTRDERESGRNERRAAEDEKMKQSLKEDYEKNQGLNAGEAEQMAELETKKQRLLADDAEAGTPRIDSLTAVGGGSTGSVGPVKDIQQEIKKINEEMRSLLETIVSETQSQARMVGQYQDSPNY